MKFIKIILLFIVISTITNCASGYQMIEPTSINYNSTHETKQVKLDYKYGLLYRKYAKKELKKGVKLVAVKITNNSDKDLEFGKDIKLTYANGSEINLLENEQVFKTLKQSPATHLLYLLLTPLNLFKTTTNSNGISEDEIIFPIGLILGPGIAGGNIIAASSANKKFKTELFNYNIKGININKGETKYGLIGFRTDAFDSLKLNLP